ncbi:MAG: hypothetical protein CK426_04675 [Legionella sp.]|nr:MAG: hypothetical protein CK423_08805 [Legionella sp.]PJD98868.1 MAG: hypothetical protein CK426_04675 [Legionella sp.]
MNHMQIEPEIAEIESSAKDTRSKREELINQAKCSPIDVIVIWTLDRWGCSVNDLFHTLNELNGLGVGFLMTGLLAIFAEFKREALGERGKLVLLMQDKKKKIMDDQ